MSPQRRIVMLNARPGAHRGSFGVVVSNRQILNERHVQSTTGTKASEDSRGHENSGTIAVNRDFSESVNNKL